MSNHLRLVKDENQQNDKIFKKNNEELISENDSNMQELSDRIASHSEMNTADVYGLLSSLENEIIDALQKGANVELWIYTYFTPRYKIKGLIKKINAML